MAFWDKLLQKLVNPAIEKAVSKSKLELIDDINKRLTADSSAWNYNSVNFDKARKKVYPQGVNFDTLRQFAVFYPIARACINYRKAQLLQLDWDITPIEVNERKDDTKYHAEIDELKDFFHFPVGDKTTSFRAFLNQVLEDVLVLDALAIYKRKTRGGKPFGYQPIDAATIKLRLNPDGTIPLPPEAAYVQTIKLDSKELTIDDLIYGSMNPRTHDPYGLAPLETLVIVVTTALKLQTYNLGFLLEGNIPEGFIELPRDIASSRDQLQDWQNAWDAMLSGDPRYQRKLKFLPEGMKYQPTKKSEDMTFERFEKWLLESTCFSEDTEVLTDQGWKLFKNLDKTERIATRSLEGKFEWENPTDYIEKETSGDLVHFESRSTDCMVTQDHDMLVKFIHSRKGKDKEFKIKAGEIVGKMGYFVPNHSLWEGIVPSEKMKIGENEIEWDIWTKFLGIWLAEGWAKGSVSGQTKQKTVGVSQQETSDDYLDIKELLEQMPYKWYSSEHDFTCWDKDLHDYLLEIGNTHTKRIPSFIKNLPTQYLQNLVDWFIRGDGYVGETSTLLISSNYELLGDFQEIIQKLGLASNIRKNLLESMTCRGETWYPSQTYRLSIRKSKHKLLNGHLVPYQGKVYCVTVPNGTILTRRNGKSLWAGNCSVFAVSPQTIGFTFDRGKGASETAWDIGEEKGLYPLANFMKEVFDRIIQQDFGKKHLEFIWTNVNPTNRLDEARVFEVLARSGAASIDEWRISQGKKPIGLGNYIMAPTGPILVKDFISGQTVAPKDQGTQSTTAQNPSAPNVNQPANKPADKPAPEPTTKADRSAIITELRRWKKTAITDWKSGKSFRDFQADFLDNRLQESIREKMALAKTRDDIATIFDPLISAETEMGSDSEVMSMVLELYDNIEQAIADKTTKN